uniref:CRISPR-associated RAMP Cmr1 n=1 Tax=uncultured Thiotrichaceae bacterium TaxID=298394 RepID=A0A6S6TS01_9GAMM|nr:MAG: CRISPR-associated RAMP Cmr1 [uncultured Thiotrichaceae bacterium]
MTEVGAVHQQFQRYDASRYLGYGLMEAFASKKKNTQAGQLNRSCINEEQIFSVTIASRNPIKSSLIDSIVALGLLGGLGSRVRHGMGSVVLESISKDGQSIWEAPADIKAYQQMLKGIVGSVATKLPPFSAFSASTRIDSLLTASNPYNVLADFGNRILLYRSWGRDGKVLGQTSEKRFKPDHDWSKFDRPRDFHPRRVVFGLPHNYGPKANMSVKPAEHDRRSSPLLFHVHKIGSEYYGISLLLESDFLPAGEKIDAGGKDVPANIEWSILHDFLDGNDKQGNSRFAQREPLL